MTTQKEVRTAFWNAHPQHTKKAGTKPNEYSTDIRVNFPIIWTSFKKMAKLLLTYIIK